MPESQTEPAQRRRPPRNWSGLGPTIALLGSWELAAQADLFPDYLVAPSKIIAVLADMIWTGDLWSHLFGSLFRAYTGFALGLIFGVIFGLLAGVSRSVATFYDPLICLTYPVPRIAILPILMVWLGLAMRPKSPSS